MAAVALATAFAPKDVPYEVPFGDPYGRPCQNFPLPWEDRDPHLIQGAEGIWFKGNEPSRQATFTRPQYPRQKSRTPLGLGQGLLGR